MKDMNRRSFIGFGVSAFASAGVLPLFALDDRQQWYEPEVTGKALLDMPIMEGFKPTVLELRVGAKKPFEMLHISDSHLVTLGSDDLARSDKKDIDYFRRRLKTFGHPQNVEMFAAAIAYSRAKNLPILHTGDLLDFVTEGGLAQVRRDMAGLKWNYAIGNHEYSGSGKPSPKMEWLKGARGRMEKTFPNAIPCASKVVNGVNIVTIDNVGMSKDMFEAQFAAIKAEFAKGLPTVLAYHIPFYTHELAQHSVDVIQTTPNHWARNSVKTIADLNSGWLASCPGKGDLKINKTLVEWLPKQKNLKALLCGHKHFEYSSPFCENVTQYVCGATFKGNAYHIKFI